MYSSLRQSEHDLVRARIIQEAMLPNVVPASLPLEIATKWVPAVEVGGDFFDCIADAGDRLHFVIGDVSGHGITAALRMAETQAYFRALMRDSDTERVESQAVLEQVNRLLAVSALDIPLLTTAMIATWHAHNGTVSWCGAGHSGFLLRANGDVEVLASTGPLLGCVTAATYAVRSASALRSGDCILLATDGIAESSQKQLRLYGHERMLQCLRQSAGETCAVMLDRLFEEAIQFCGDESQQDDMTAVLARAR